MAGCRFHSNRTTSIAEYIAVTAQGYPGKGDKYRLCMPSKQIDSVIRMAAGLMPWFFSMFRLIKYCWKIPLLETYLKMLQVKSP
jgi:hypothetical protein